MISVASLAKYRYPEFKIKLNARGLRRFSRLIAKTGWKKGKICRNSSRSVRATFGIGGERVRARGGVLGTNEESGPRRGGAFGTSGKVFRASGNVFGTNGKVFRTSGEVFATNEKVFRASGGVFSPT